VIVLDSSGHYSALGGAERPHEHARRALGDDPGPLILSPFALCELDYLLATSVGSEAELGLLEDVAGGAYELASIAADDVAEARGIVERHRDLGIGLTDASLVVLADRYSTDRILTLDERHFRALRTLDGRPFSILPADA